ncbi:MAG: hypothetical protein J7621_30170, partial [Niastella sp.]|nr:hypothetical protein [Niastella sp.]
MNFNNLNTYNSSHELAFEALCTQLFEQWVTNEHSGNVEYLQTINGSGGDGGVESCANLKDGSIIGMQAKWFLYSLDDSQIRQIKKSIITAMKIRPQITHYIICLPRNPQSEKMGRGGKPVKKTEESRINKMKTQVAKSYPELNLEIWYASRLLKELQKPLNDGIAKYWFDKEVIALAYLQYRFDLAESGWLKERYTPALHTQGAIKDTIDQLLFTPEYRSKVVEVLKDYMGVSGRVLKAIETFMSMAGAGHALAPTLQRITEDILTYNQACTQLQMHLTNGRYTAEVDPPSFLYLGDAMDEVETARLPVTFKNIRPALLVSLDAFSSHLDMWDLKGMVLAWQLHSCIIVGGPATGKTHGIADAVKSRLAAKMPAMIIQAKAVNAADWASILQHGLGGMEGWTDLEIFRALEAVAVATDIRRAKDTKVDALQPEPTSVLICIDGLDERHDDTNWKNRINELRVYRQRFPRINFVFTVRSTELEEDESPQWNFGDAGIKTVYLDLEGDVAVSALVPSYLKTYDIRYEGVPWILEAFDNALSLRLFCEQYKGQDLGSLSSPVVTSLRNLLDAKIKRFEEEFSDRQQPPWTRTQQVERNSLLSLAELFTIRGDRTQEELTKHLITSFPGLIDHHWAGHLLEAFCDFGILQSYGVEPDDGLSPVKYFYNMTYQSYIDYFTAIRATNQIIRAREKVLPAMLHYPYASYAIRLTATALLADNHILVGEDGYWTSDFRPNQLLELQLEVLTVSGKKNIDKYLPAIKKQFFETTENRNLIFLRFVLPNISRPDISLGTDLIHDLLNAFPSAFARDLVWSGPDHFSPSRELRIASYLQRIPIAPYHMHTGMPLLYAWSFSSVDGPYREWARHQLAIWAHDKVKYFIELLQLVFPCNDIQIKQDLAVVMAAVANMIHKAGCGLEWLVKWIDDNVFARDKIKMFHDVIIRHSCRIVVEKAYRLGECSEEQFKRAMPPYPPTNHLLSLDMTGETSPQGGRFPIVHDLAWYVIKEAYEKFRFYTDKNEKIKGDLIKRYEAAYATTLT